MTTLTQTLLLLALACTVGLIFADALPGAWWQWLLSAVVLLFTAAVAAVENETRWK